MERYDIIIVGGGPAGLTAALYCARAKLNTLVLEKKMPGGQILNTERIENCPGFDSISGLELAQRMEQHARKFGANIKLEEMKEIHSEKDAKVVKTTQGVYHAGAVILAAGGEPRWLNVPGEKELLGKGVSYCALCDGPFFAEQTIAVVGGGDAAVGEAIYLTKFAQKVYLIHRRNSLRAKKELQGELLNNPKVEVIWDSVVEKIEGKDTVERILLKNVKTGKNSPLEVGGVFIYIGFVPNSNLFKKNLELDERGYIKTDYKMSTSMEGVFAAGDVRFQLAKQITNAMSDGTTAAIAAEAYLKEKGLV